MRLVLVLGIAVLLWDACIGPWEPPDTPISQRDALGPAPGTKAEPSGPVVPITISGRVTFARLLPTNAGLDPIPVSQPARNVVVEVVQHDDISDLVATTATDDNGDYVVSFSTGRDFFVRARTTSGTDTNMDLVTYPWTYLGAHAVCSPILHRLSSQTVDLHADTSLPANRAGAFALLDTVARLRESVAAAFPALGKMQVYWSYRYDDRTSHARPRPVSKDNPVARPAKLYVAGGSKNDPLNTNHDEFDETVIAREWMRLLLFSQSRDDSCSGRTNGEPLIATTAYTIGVATALGCALLNTDVYRNTFGFPDGARSAFQVNLESGATPGQGGGYTGEWSVAQVVWDLIDGGTDGPPDADGDQVAIPFSELLESLRNMRARSAPYEVIWLPSLLQQLIDDGRLTEADANTLMQTQGEQFPPAGGDTLTPELALDATQIPGVLNAWAGTDPNPGLNPQGNALFLLRVPAKQHLKIKAHVTGKYRARRNELLIEVRRLDGRFVQDKRGQRERTVVLDRWFSQGTYIVRVRHVPWSQADSEDTAFTVRVEPVN